MSEFFSTIIQKQAVGHCGPTSLSSCLGLLGVDITPAKIRATIKKSYFDVAFHGVDEGQLIKAATRLGFTCKHLRYKQKIRGSVFLRALDKHLAKGYPAVLSVEDSEHWVALLAKKDGRYIVMDPLDYDKDIEFAKPDSLLDWAFDGDEDNEYFAILVSTKKSEPARWTLTDDFIKLLRRGSVQRALTWYGDLKKIIERSSLSANYRKVISVETILKSLEGDILSNVAYWVDSSVQEVTLSELRSAYCDCVTVAAASSLSIASDYDQAKLVTQLACLFMVYSTFGELEVE